MDTKAGFHLYNKEEAIKIFHLREQLKSHKLTPDSIDIFLARISQDEVKEHLHKITHQPIGFLNILEGVQQWLGGKEAKPTNAKIVAYTILQTGANPIMLQALHSYNIGKLNTFITYYDYAEGMFETISAVLGATVELEGKGQEVTEEASFRWLQDRKAIPSGLLDSFDRVHRKEYQYFADILKEDPTGLEVVSEMLRELTVEMEFKEKDPEGDFPYPRILPYQYPKLYVAGAIFAKQIYEGLYQLWEKEQCSN
ncbi:MAG: hypothetical protein Q8P92_02840 [Candidatus Daviesbacteria bacterium]|nr:hypothetical protein [Candidatus Daviesbacteria bacterium]